MRSSPDRAADEASRRMSDVVRCLVKEASPLKLWRQVSPSFRVYDLVLRLLQTLKPLEKLQIAHDGVTEECCAIRKREESQKEGTNAWNALRLRAAVQAGNPKEAMEAVPSTCCPLHFP